MKNVTESVEKKMSEEESWIKIWEEECGGRCAVMHMEKCPRYEKSECKFPETEKAKRLLRKHGAKG